MPEDPVIVPKKVKRSLLKNFLDVTPSAGASKWELMGPGITGQTINYNPQTEEQVYIHQDTGETDLTGYKPSIPTPQTAMVGDPVYDFVDGLRRKRAVLSEARSSVLTVYTYLPQEDGAYPAEKNACSIQLDDFGGDGGGSLKINYTIHFVGDPVQGAFNPSTKTFIPTPAAP